MGFTHYWYRNEHLNPTEFAAAVADCKKVCDACTVEIAFDLDEPLLAPVFSVDLIRFNGIGEDGHETFYIPLNFDNDYRRTDDEGRLFAFCKTARKPYDDVVTACLIVFQHHLNGAFLVKSDGDFGEWKEGREICQQVLGFGIDFDPKED